MEISDAKDIQIYNLQCINQQQEREIEELTWLAKQLSDSLKYHLLLHKQTEAEAFAAEYDGMVEKVNQRVKEIDEERSAWRRRLKSAEINDKAFQQGYIPLMKEKKQLFHAPQRFQEEKLYELFPTGTITFEDVRRFLANPDAMEPLWEKMMRRRVVC